MDNNWEMQESTGMKPDWFFVKTLLQWKWLNKSLYNNLSNILPTNGSELTSLKCFIRILLSIL